MLPKTLSMIVLVFGLSLLGCDRGPQTQPPRPVPEVSTVTIQTREIMLTTELPGRTTPYRMAEIRPQVNGLINERLFTEGSDVKAGEVLYQIDPAPFQAVLDNAEASLKRAQAGLPATRARVERYREALSEKAVSQQDYDNAVAALKQAEADTQYWKATVRTAQINLGYCRVTAPISGRIGRSNVSEGAIVTAFQPVALATIQQLDPIYVDVPQSTTELLSLKQHLKNGPLGQTEAKQNNVKLILEDGTVYPHEGELQFSDVTVDPTTGSVNLRAVFPNPESVLLPGMFVRATIKEGIDEGAILVPQQSVSRDQRGEPFVLTVDAGSKVVQKTLALDRAVGDQWLVSKGLAPGDRVIVEGLQMLRPGTVVKAAAYDKHPAGKDLAGSPGKHLPKRNDGGA